MTFVVGLGLGTGSLSDFDEYTTTTRTRDATLSESKPVLLLVLGVHPKLACCSPAVHCHHERKPREWVPLRREFRKGAQAG